jgi:hypothetical protein
MGRRTRLIPEASSVSHGKVTGSLPGIDLLEGCFKTRSGGERERRASLKRPPR